MTRVYKREDSDLIEEVIALSKKDSKLIKSSTYDVPGCEDLDGTDNIVYGGLKGGEGLVVRSWKMNEYKYYDVPSPFPTLARGLFTAEVDVKALEAAGWANEAVEIEEGVKHRIVIRGYDKFFNIGEVPWTTWESLKEHTSAPYTLSLKSNGCIIFIAGITPTRLIVTSKHSVGSGDETVSHAMVGRKWLKTYLERKGKTEADLAKVLFENGWTAIAELCDDSFEEHVLGYPPEQTGLHLHGINVCSKHFQTLPTADVDSFAEEWGFIRTPTLVLDSIEEVQAFTSEVGKTGKWNGEAVEGFVVRTSVSSSPVGKKVSPYETGSSFFFKVKFDEPYMMYRDWREITKTLLGLRAKGGEASMKAAKLPKNKLKREETQKYVEWVIRDIKENSGMYEEYNKGRGIIKTRERFLARLEGGSTADLGEKLEGSREKKEFGKTVIVPIAIPGCGKTTVSLALAKLFGFGHTQSDNVQAKKPSPVFVKNVVNCLKDNDVVIADKNNHLKQHRTLLRDAVSVLYGPPVRLLALYWDVNSKPPAMIHRICSDRILARGTNHQTLVPSPTSKSHHEEVVWMFINSTEELAGEEVDEVIEMQIEENETIEDQVARAVEGVCNALGLERPSEERVQEALEFVRKYEAGESGDQAQAQGGKEKGKAGKGKGKGQMVVEGQKKSKKAAPRYFGILPEFELNTFIDGEVAKLQSVGGSERDLERFVEFWSQLKENKRVTKRPHVTIAHKNSVKENGEEGQLLWDRCGSVSEMLLPPVFEGVPRRVVWSDKVMAVTFEDVGIVALPSTTGTTRLAETSDPLEAEPEEEEGGVPELVENINRLALNDSDLEGGRGANGPSKTDMKIANALVENLPSDVKKRLHVTVGTRDGGIAPVEGKYVVERFREMVEEGKTSEKDQDEEKVWTLEFAEPTKVRGLLKALFS